jgi:hypothetical protein
VLTLPSNPLGGRGRNSDKTLIRSKLGWEPPRPIRESAPFTRSQSSFRDSLVVVASGVRGRNSDNTLIKSKLGWEPATPIAQGLRETYFWIKGQIEKERQGGMVNDYSTSTVRGGWG